MNKQAAAPAENDASLASVIDTIEAIIIALIVALTFRAYVVEAFVIPTGSMAPTLLGAHFNVICPACGFSFTREADLKKQAILEKGEWKFGDTNQMAELTSNTVIPADEVPILCPNCQYAISAAQLPQFLETRRVLDGKPPPRTIPFAWTNNGDRILVLKYLYSVLEPERWDVIVFKEPQDAKDNYIKRLIGLPGETVEIIGGDIFIARGNGEGGRKVPEILPQNLLIARKPDYLQKDLWQLVYDNDYYPRDEFSPRPPPDPLRPDVPGPAWRNPWQPGNDQDNWDIKGPVINYRGHAESTLEFIARHPYTLNLLGYNNDSEVADVTRRTVGDLRLEALWMPRESGSVSLTLGKPQYCFRVDWKEDGVTVLRLNAERGEFQKELGPIAHEAPVAGRAYHVALNNVDRSIQFYIDGKPVLGAHGHETPWTAAQALQEEREQSQKEERDRALRETKNLPPDPADVRISVTVHGGSQLAHLKLLRDLYYTQSNPDFQRPPMLTANEGHPLTLGEDEFFALGDNSRRSSDGRYWNMSFPALDDLGTPPGVVPRRYLLGKAFFVYWPAGYRVISSQSVPSWMNMPLVPNTGEMRFIH